MTNSGTFYINEHMRLNSRHFCLLMHKVDQLSNTSLRNLRRALGDGKRQLAR